MTEDARPDFALVVMQEEEYEAVEAVFDIPHNPSTGSLPTGEPYVRCDFAGKDGGLVSICTREMYNDTSLLITDRLLNALRPRHVFLIGSACGNPNKVRLGDVVIATTVAPLGRGVLSGVVHGWEPGATEPTKWPLMSVMNPRPFTGDIVADVRNQVISYCTYRTSKHKTWNRECRRVLALVGAGALCGTRTFGMKMGLVASGDWVLKFPDEPTAHSFWQSYRNDGFAYDMESAGFLGACTRRERTDQPLWLVVRGISDYGIKGQEKDHKGAAVLAALWVKSFLVAKARNADTVLQLEPAFVGRYNWRRLYELLDWEEGRNLFVSKRRFVRDVLKSDPESILALQYAINQRAIWQGVKRMSKTQTEKIWLAKNSNFWQDQHI